ncbi:hypothetical protein [Actinophytocola sp.]|uniref:hypothetical protein n=1 Tax=Actinophytocola sp. TaxID=1872138 RepID=UPI002EDB1101
MAQATWDGVTLRSVYGAGAQAERDAFADAARDGDRATVLARLARSPELVNAWRPSGPGSATRCRPTSSRHCGGTCTT